MPKILIVDDDPGISTSLGLYLKASGFEVATCLRGDLAADAFRREKPDLAVVDINLPGKDGFAVVRDIRAQSNVPVLMLSARDAEKDKLAGLELGADDYVEKPFSPREVVARIKSILRRGAPAGEQTAPAQYKDLKLDDDNLTVTRGGSAQTFTKSEYAILRTLLSAGGKIVTREKLMQDIMGYSNYLTDRTIDTHVKNIRRKLGDDVVETVRGLGYKSF